MILQKQIIETASALDLANSGVQQIMSRHYVLQYEWDKAEIAADKAIELSPGDVDALLQLVNIAYLKGDHETAVFYARKAAEYDPLSISALQYLALTYSFSGQCAEVRKIVELAVAIEPEHSRTRYLLGECLLVHEASPESALAVRQTLVHSGQEVQ